LISSIPNRHSDDALAGIMATPQLRPIDPTHEDVFAERYYSLLKWASQLTGGNAALAQDLVHDAYVQFVLARPDLHRIQSLDRYLYGMLRNLQISYLRRAARTQSSSLLAVEYDSAELSLKHGSRRDELRVLEELWQACEYACARKETSRAGSVMILRFFHGYYPAEIAAITSSSKAAVSESLRAAREETIRYLRNPSSLSCIARGQSDSFAARPFCIGHRRHFARSPKRYLLYQQWRVHSARPITPYV
jgi:RNA polymerase sigma factor (sigma-70 family)